MKFRKFDSIDNITRQKTIDYIIMNGYANKEWVQTLKIHGANYSFWCNGDEVLRGKRSGFIKGESFYGDNNFDYSENVMEIFKWAKSSYENITLYGEIYGGKYDHPDVPKVNGAVQVQKEVQYIPHNDFIMFNVLLNGEFLSWDAVRVIGNKFGIKTVPELARGTFQDLIQNDVVFLDPIHKEFGLPPIDDNYAEGWVMAPVHPLFTPVGQRIVLKGKNPAMSEKSKRTKKPKVDLILSDEEKALLEEISQYVTENRLRNVLSHGEIETVTSKDFGKLLGLFAKDILDDYKKDYPGVLEEMDNKDRKRITKYLNKISAELIRANFVNIIDGVF